MYAKLAVATLARFVLCGLWLFNLPFTFADTTTTFKVEKEIQLLDEDSLKRFILNVGELPSGVSGTINVTVQNETSEDWPIAAVKTSCDCITANISHEVIRPGGTALLTLKLTTASRLKVNTPAGVLTVTLEGNDGPRTKIGLALKYRLQGLLSFKQGVYSVLLGSQTRSATVRLAFYATDPINATSCNVSTQVPALGNTKIVKDPENPELWLVVVSFDMDDIPKSGLSSWVKIKDPKTGRTAQALLVLTIRQPVRVSPLFIRLLPDKDRPGMLTANCIIDVEPPLDQTNGVAGVLNNISVEARLEGMNLKANVSYMGKSYHRCKLSCPVEFLDSIVNLRKEEDGGDPLAIRWEVTANGSKSIFESRMTFSRNALQETLPSEE